MAMSIVLRAFALLALLQLSAAAQYTVGDASGWVGLRRVNYDQWSTSKTFRVGDTLLFPYMQGMHDVVEVNRNGYDGCNASSPIATYTDGNTVISLTSEGQRWFICSFPQHCNSGGMRLSVVTVAAATAQAPLSPPPAVPVPASSPRASPASPPTPMASPPRAPAAPTPAAPTPAGSVAPPPTVSAAPPRRAASPPMVASPPPMVASPPPMVAASPPPMVDSPPPPMAASPAAAPEAEPAADAPSHNGAGSGRTVVASVAVLALAAALLA